MSKNFKLPDVMSLKIILDYIHSHIFPQKETSIKVPKRKISKKNISRGTAKSDGIGRMELGIHILERLSSEGSDQLYSSLLKGSEDVSRNKLLFSRYQFIINDTLRRLRLIKSDSYEIQQRIDLLQNFSEIAQAARDGVLIRQDEVVKIVDGKPKKIKVDVPMQPNEVLDSLRQYYELKGILEAQKVENYLGLGLSFAGLLGSIFPKGNDDDSNKQNTGSLIGLGTTAIGSFKLLQNVLRKKDHAKAYELREKQMRMINDLLGNESPSRQSEKESIASLNTVANEEQHVVSKKQLKNLGLDLIIDLLVAIIAGVHIDKQVELNDDGKINGRSLATALVSLSSTKSVVRNIIDTMQGFQDTMKTKSDFENVFKQVYNIISQMEEKVYPLEGADKSFDSIKIENFSGKFYPKTNYETNTKEYGFSLEIPEFSIKRGDVVLLSGDSGAGKSTLLSFLKRGDINNRKSIFVDNQPVDNFGNEYASFNFDTKLGSQENVLEEITHSQNISNLDEVSKQTLLKLLNDLDLHFSLNDLASKRYSEFSQGQQRRLDFLALLYRMKDASSVVIADEPFNNVQQDLIEKEMQILIDYAKDYNIMLIFTTHNLDLVPKNMLTKWYHISNKGPKSSILEQKDLTKASKIPSAEDDAQGLV